MPQVLGSVVLQLHFHLLRSKFFFILDIFFSLSAMKEQTHPKTVVGKRYLLYIITLKFN